MEFILIAVIITIAFIIIKGKREKKPENENVIIEETEMGSDIDLERLQVYYKGGIKIKIGETIRTEEEDTVFEVRGFGFKEKEIKLNSNKIIWGKSCKCVKWGMVKGSINVASCKNKGKLERNVWVKYRNGVTFPWKIQFK